MSTTTTTWSEVPLTEEQEGLLYLHRMEPERGRYHVPVAFEITGGLDLATLEAALRHLVRRHPLLTAVPGDGTLHADPERPMPLTRLTREGLSTGDAVPLLRDGVAQPLDLDGAGLSRALLVTAAPDRHYLLIVVHHLALDGESAGVLVTDLWEAYTAAYAGERPPGEAAGPDVYRREAARRSAELERHGEQLTGYWREVIAGGAGPVELSSDGDTGDDGTGVVALDLPGDPVAAFARQRRVGVFAVLLAAYMRTLGRYARAPRVTVAVPVSTRPGAELDGVIGNYVNTVLVRSPEAAGDLSTGGYVRQVQTAMARAIDHRALPYPRIAGLAAGTGPLFDCVFTYQSWYDTGALGSGVPGLRLRLLREVHQPVVGDLTLEMFAEGDRLRGSLRYARGRLAEQTVTAFAEQFAATLAALTGDPDTPIAALPDVVTAPMAGAAHHVDPAADVDSLLRDAARRHAGRTALRERDRRWTYRELDERVATLAAGLRDHGVQPGHTVGISLPRSAEQVLAVLAVLRAGAVFVPLDPGHPPRRRADIAEQAALALVVTTAGATVPDGVPAVTLDDLDGPGGVPAPVSRPGDPAYILFTSGSTGRPKGVVVEHRAMVNHLDWSRRYFAVTPEDVMAFSGTLSFDVTLHQLFVPLVCGACLLVVPEGEQHDPDAMAETLRAGGVTLLHVVPALLRLLTDSPVLPRVKTLRAVVSAGEALTNNLRRRFMAAHPARLYNAYGPTEATVYATVFDASGTPGRWDRQADVPIGRPLDNIDCHVLDESLRPVPPGAPGELCLSGVALAAGYHGDPQRTAEQFREIDGADGPVRLYRTGDLVRLLPSGELSYLGRLDHQVKLNGFRVELGEVEAALLDGADVRDVVAVVRRLDEGHAQLVAYVTPATVDVGRLRAAVARRLPAYMVPTHLLALDELPRLPSGKVDRKALPDPRTVVPDPAPAPAVPDAPSGRVLEQVRTAWTAILGPPDGDDAHFFATGGDSILAMRLVSELRRAGLTLDLRLLHDHPRLADLAQALSTAAPRDPIVPAGEAPQADGPAPIQRWFLETVRTDRQHWNQSVLLRLTEPTDPVLLGMALQALVYAHPELSARLDGDRLIPGEPFAGQRPGDLLDTVTVRSGPERDDAIRAVQRSLDPAAGTMIRARLLHDTTDGADMLLVVVHHLVVDGVSWRILLGDLDLAVAALHKGELPRLPAEHRSYRAWLAGLPGVAAGETTAAYWQTVVRRRHAAGALLRAAPAGVEGDSRRLERTLDPDRTAALLGPVPSALGVRVHDLLTALVTLALARWRGCDPVTLDVETHGRGDDGELARTVGWFTALYPLVVDVDRTRGPAAHVRAVAAELAAVPHGGASYGAVRWHAADERVRAELAAAPAALVSFNYLGRLDAGAAGKRFAIVGAAVPGERSPRAERGHTVELYGLVRDGLLTIGATYTEQPVDGVGGSAVTALLDHLEELCRAVTAEAAGPAEIPITPQQYGILVDSLARPGAGRYLEQLSWVWQGPLDLDRFTAAWAHAAGRHAALRSAFRWDGQARTVVLPQITPEVRVVTDRPWPEVTAEDRSRDFDLGRAPLFRLTVQPGDGEHRVLFTFHHALLDGWSTALVLEDFYRAYLGEPRPVDPDEPDARGHARWLAAQNTTDAEAFWSSRLCGLRPLTRPGVTGDAEPGAGAGRHRVRLPRAGLTGLLAAAAQRGATESTVLQGLWALLLWRAAGTADAAPVCFGVTSSGRAIDLPGAERIAGLLMTTLPLTVEVRPDEPVLDLLARTRTAALEMATFEWVATGQVHDWSGHRGGSPLFESLLVVENYPSDLGDVGALLEREGIRIHGMSGAGGETAYPCTLLVHRDGDESVLTVVHDRRTVGDTAARRIGELWSTVLGRLAERPDLTVAELAGAITDADLPVLAQPAVPTREAGPSRWPDGPHTEAVREVWRRVLGVTEVAPGDHFFESGGHSLLASRFLREVGERCGLPVRLDDLLTNPTAGGFAQALTGGGPATVRSTVVPLAPGAGPAVYLVHPPGGQVACYGELAGHYPGAEPLFGLRDPRADQPGDPPAWTVRELAERHLRELGPRTEAGPMVLGGFSGGGVVAHEMARLLHERTGATPLVLIIDAAAPTGRVTDTSAEGSFLRRVREHDRDGGAAGDGATPQTGDGYLDELATVAEWMHGAGQGDPYALLASTLEAVERHEPRPYPGPVVVLRARDTAVGAGEQFAVDDYYARPDMGWGGLCGELEVRTVAGNHITLLTGDQARELAGTVATIVRHHEKGGNSR